MSERIKEGDLYKMVRVFGVDFELRYGYYDDTERESRYNDPIPIYPDFKRAPRYSEEGYPFVTAMQDACEDFRGRDPESGCYGCSHFRHGEELLGICMKGRKP